MICETSQLLSRVKHRDIFPLPPWREPPQIGKIYSGKVIEIIDGVIVFETKNGERGLIEWFQMSDTHFLSRRQVFAYDINSQITAMFLEECEIGNSFTCKPCLISNRQSIYSRSTQLKPGKLYFGYIDAIVDSGSIVKLIGSACGIIPKEKFILGETVCFSVLQEGYLPILEFNTHDFLINQIENMIDSINLNAHAYSVGDIISLSTINGQMNNDEITYNDFDISLTVFNTDKDSKNCMIIDINCHSIFAVCIDFITDKPPPITCQAKKVYSSGFISLLKYRDWLFMVRNYHIKMNDDDCILITTEFDIADSDFVFKKTTFSSKSNCPV